MTDGKVFLAIASLICLGVFLNGLRFARMSEQKVREGRLQIEMPSWLGRDRTPAARVNLLGRIQMMLAPAFLLLVTALCFGLLGPVDGIQTIQLSSE